MSREPAVSPGRGLPAVAAPGPSPSFGGRGREGRLGEPGWEGGLRLLQRQRRSLGAPRPAEGREGPSAPSNAAATHSHPHLQVGSWVPVASTLAATEAENSGGPSTRPRGPQDKYHPPRSLCLAHTLLLSLQRGMGNILHGRRRCWKRRPVLHGTLCCPAWTTPGRRQDGRRRRGCAVAGLSPTHGEQGLPELLHEVLGRQDAQRGSVDEGALQKTRGQTVTSRGPPGPFRLPTGDGFKWAPRAPRAAGALSGSVTRSPHSRGVLRLALDVRRGRPWLCCHEMLCGGAGGKAHFLRIHYF